MTTTHYAQVSNYMLKLDDTRTVLLHDLKVLAYANAPETVTSCVTAYDVYTAFNQAMEAEREGLSYDHVATLANYYAGIKSAYIAMKGGEL